MKEIKYTQTTTTHNGKEVEILLIEQGLEHMNMSDNKCCLCGLKIRNGKHSWAVAKANIAIEGHNGVIIHIAEDDLISDDGFSQGGSAIGSECRKQLPAQFTINTTHWGK